MNLTNITQINMENKAKQEAERLVNIHSVAECEKGFINQNKHRHINNALITVEAVVNNCDWKSSKFWYDVKKELKKML